MPILKSVMNILVIVLLSSLITVVNAQSPLARVPASQPVIFDANNNPVCCPDLYHVFVDERALIQSTLTSNIASQSFVYIVKITDSDNVTLLLSWFESKLGKNERTNLTQSWIPDREGRYKIETFVWDSLETPVALSPVRTVEVAASYGLTSLPVAPVGQFSIIIAPNLVDLPERGSVNVTIILRNIHDLNGSQVDLASQASCKCLEATLNPTTVTLPQYGEVYSILTVRATHWSDYPVYLTVNAGAKSPAGIAGNSGAQLAIVMRK